MKIQIGLVVLLVICGFALITRTQKTDSAVTDDKQKVQQLVEHYCELVLNSEFAEANKYITGTPLEYDMAKDKEVAEYRETIGEAPRHALVETISATSEQKSLGVDVKDADRLEWALSRSEADARLLYRDAAYIDQVSNIWVKDNQARVRVILRSRSSDRYRATRDFLLFKKAGEWKLFLIDEPGLVNIYGMS